MKNKNKYLILYSIAFLFTVPAHTMRFLGDDKPHPSAHQAEKPKEKAEKCLGKITTPRVDQPNQAKRTGISTGQQVEDGVASPKHTSVAALLAKQQAERHELVVQHDHRIKTQQGWLSDGRPLFPSGKYVQPQVSREAMERVVQQAQAKKCTQRCCKGNKKYACAALCLLTAAATITPCCVYIPECQACCCAVMSGLNLSA